MGFRLHGAWALIAAAAALAGCSTLPGWMILQRRSQITDHQHFANAPIAASPTPRLLAVDPVPPRLPAPAGGEAFDAMLERNGTVAFIVLQRGRITMERYFNGYRRDSLATSFSVAKSVVSLLVGQAIADGHIAGVDDAITRYVPELAQRDPRFERVRLRHLLDMRSGIAFEEQYRTPWSDAAVFYLTDDLPRAVRGMRIEAEPDTRFQYSSGDTQLLGLAIERATGRPLARLLEEKLWQPMGAEYDASQWRRMGTAAPNELGVRPTRDFYAQGLHGQFIYIAPEQQMVIVRLGRDHGGDHWWPGLMTRIAAMN